jgi:hypothetical protein
MKVVGRIISGIQAGMFKKVLFPISASFLINFNAA